MSMKKIPTRNSQKEDAPEPRPGLFKSLYAKLNLLALIILALIVAQVPGLGNLLSWQTTLFHEISHGLAALVTGGRVLKIDLHFSGSGLCYTSGGVGWLISLSGYAGAALWGLVVYLLADAVPKNRVHLPAAFLVAVLASSALFYARNFQSWVIITIIAVLYAAAVKFRDRLPLKLFLKVAGLSIILEALKAPIALLQRQVLSDATDLAGQTGVPELFWIALWLATAFGVLAFIWKIEKRPAKIFEVTTRR